MRDQALGVQPVHDLDSWRVVGDAEVAVAEGPCALRHLQHRRPAIAPFAMRMDVALIALEIELGFVVLRGLLRLLAESRQVAALARFDELGEHLGDARAHPLERCQLAFAVQVIEVGPLEGERPGRH